MMEMVFPEPIGARSLKKKKKSQLVFLWLTWFGDFNLDLHNGNCDSPVTDSLNYQSEHLNNCVHHNGISFTCFLNHILW